ncbi:ribokinase [Halomonas sp. ISL-60]|uniref:ribokinase n=1 Tax=unclassified Halomonas TaxID=2609666 RepID=UPI0007D99399|nr:MULTISPECIES: ribokinase [unclassified Halomonas]MBT2771590.1 ribokinase [Halomonas sp. ISL-60]MBT2787719.1 ribokinase [Halomonas sp. ISL-106]MBT2796922.1 ribokinase [Halomonas sp. ISL-104]MBT2801345.1 ribokinase [Halomonas sp. ISL-56]OAL61476.1 ribokinase [Halomonas sp. ALS9]
MIFNFGSINIDHTYRVPYFVRPGETLESNQYSVGLGGKGVNQSLAIARAKGSVSHWGRVSSIDAWVARELEAAGVGVKDVELTTGPSGHAVIQIDSLGENAILLFAGANHGFTQERIAALIAQTAPGDTILLQNECNGLDQLIPLAVSHGCKVIFNPAPMTSKVASLPLDQCDLLFFNRTEAAALLDMPVESSAADLLRRCKEALGDVEVVLTLGSEGAWYQRSSETLFQEALKVKAIDTTAAGDTFVGYFLAARQAGLTPSQSLQRATAAAALAVQKHGAANSIPMAEEVDRFMCHQ